MRRVAADPISTRVRMSARAGWASANGTISMVSSARLTAVANTTGVAAGRMSRSSANAAPSCQGRAREIGLYSAITKPAPAAACRRLVTISQGLRLSDSEMAQKSCPSGAPTRAATANMAEMPGITSTSMSRHSGAPRSIASNTALAMANTPVSPEETTATCRPAAESSSACRARLISSRLSEAWRISPGRGGTRSI